MKRKIIPITILLISFALNGCNGDTQSISSQALSAMESGDYSTALSLYDKSQSEGIDVKKSLRGMGIAYLGMGQYDRAIDYFTKALGQSNGLVEDMDIDISYYMAVAQYKSGRSDAALDTINAIIDIRPSKDTAYYMRGRIELTNGEKELAVADYNRAIELAPNNYDHYIRICEDLRGAGYESEGNEYIQKAMNSGGKLSDYTKGVLEFYLGSYTDARNDLEKAAKNQKNENIALYLGRTYEALGDMDYAISLYQEAIGNYPSAGKIYNQLALAKISQRDYKAALEFVDQGIQNSNGEAIKELKYNKIVICEYLYDFDTAAQLCSEYVELYPDDAAAARENIFLSSR